MDPVRYRILGTAQATRPDGTPVAIGGTRLRALLTVLALRPGRAVPAGLLVEEVWAGDPPADAPGALQALVGRLRRALGAGAIASVEGGYRLTAVPDDVDLHRFERLAADGLGALADGDPAKAAALLDDALALWQGPVLADLPDRTAEAARLAARRLDALRARHTAALALGQAEQALPELTALCDAHPLDEPLQGLRLRALRDAGRTAEALAAYEDVRRLLADRLGSDPGPELRALHAELLDPQDRSGAAPPPGGHGVAAAPSAPARPRAEAPRPTDSPGPPASSALAALSAPGGAAPAPAVGNLRARLTSFVGRESDIDAIRDDLTGARLVTLLGPGGAGKTRLSQEAAERVRDAAPDGVWLAELAPVDLPEAVPQAVLTAVGARDTVLYGAGAEEMRAVADRHDDPLDRLVEHCGRRRMLIILDNCEHVVGAAARLAEELLARCPRLTLLATSREPLGVPGEVLRPVEPLPEPVALRLLAERLDDRFRLLTSGSRTVLPRQQTLRAVVDWSWDLLDADEREVLGRLSVFAGGCDLAAAEAVCGPHALETLGSLVDKSLVVAGPSADGEMRYRLLETVAEYAGERLDETGGRTAAERAHLTYYRELARTTEPLLRGAQQRTAITRFELEYDNLRTALRRAVADRDEQEALYLTLSLTGYWGMRDLRLETRTWCRETMALGPDPFAEPVRPAAPVWRRATDSPPPLSGEDLLEARRAVHLAHLACMDTELDAWQNPAAQAKLRAIAGAYGPGLPQTCRLPGALWYYAVMLTGDMERLRELIDANVRTCRETPGFEWELAFCLQWRGNILANRTDWAGDAAQDAEEALAIFRRLGDTWGTAEALSVRAEAYERSGAYREAAAAFEEAREQAEVLGARAQVAVLSARLGSVLLEAGEDERGERLLREVIEQGDGVVNEAMPAARLFLAGRLGVTGRIAEAREQLRLLREEFAIAHFAVFDAFILGAQAWLDALDGCHEQALTTVRRALEQAGDPLARVIAPHMRCVYLTIAAVALAGLDGGARAHDAVRLLAAADALLPSGHVRHSMERASHDLAVRRLHEVLEETAYAHAYAEGGGLSFEEAAALL
ncbi:BTAD domain-containing putative transcriptional regulator [Streptomyces longwoodensis]|uniref:AfsR/SARP family transcriptional regulator n=1 Tax=Streptomyces longwoodensis TaxID=68231 RepID=UPI0033DC3AFE